MNTSVWRLEMDVVHSLAGLVARFDLQFYGSTHSYRLHHIRNTIADIYYYKSTNIFTIVIWRLNCLNMRGFTYFKGLYISFFPVWHTNIDWCRCDIIQRFRSKKATIRCCKSLWVAVEGRDNPVLGRMSQSQDLEVILSEKLENIGAIWRILAVFNDCKIWLKLIYFYFLSENLDTNDGLIFNQGNSSYHCQYWFSVNIGSDRYSQFIYPESSPTHSKFVYWLWSRSSDLQKVFSINRDWRTAQPPFSSWNMLHLET